MQQQKTKRLDLRDAEPVTLIDSPRALSTHEPSTHFYEKFGISGCSMVTTRRGEMRMKDLQDTDAMISSAAGFIKPVAVLRPTDRPNSPLSYMICKGAFREDCPQRDIIVGQSVEMKFALPRESGKPTRYMTPKMGAIREVFSFLSSTNSPLLVPVFENRTAVQVDGVYVICPSVDDFVVDCVTS